MPLNDDPGPDIANNGEAPATGVDTSGLALQINRQLDAILTEVANGSRKGALSLRMPKSIRYCGRRRSG